MNRKWIAILAIFCIAASSPARAPQKYPVRNKISQLPGLVAYWPEVSTAGNILDHSGKFCDLTAVQTTVQAGETGPVRYFDGVDDYCYQKVYVSKIGTVTMATVAAGALFNDAGQDFTAYAGSSGSTPYWLRAVDTGGRVAYGYIGEEGTGETLGSELLTNGNFTAWTLDNPDSWTVTGEAGGNIFTQNPAGKCQMVTDGTAVYMRQTSILTSGKLYYLTMNIDTVTTAGVGINIRNYAVTTIYTNYTTTGAKTKYFTANDAGIGIIRDSSVATNYTFDDISIKQVTALPVNTGVKIYSTKNGSTQSWASVESGFLPNSVASYSVRRADFQITGDMTLGAWVKPNGADEEGYLFSKLDSSTIGFGLYWDGSVDAIKFFYDGVAQVKSSSAVFTDNNVCVFVTVTRTAAGAVAFYRNGVAAGTATGATPISDSYWDLLIGVRRVTVSSVGVPFAGSIAMPFVCNRVLLAGEVKEIYEDTRGNFLK